MTFIMSSYIRLQTCHTGQVMSWRDYLVMRSEGVKQTWRTSSASSRLYQILQFIQLQSILPSYRHMEPQTFWSHDLDLLGPRDVIGHVTIGLGIRGFLLIVHCNCTSTVHDWDITNFGITTLTFWGHVTSSVSSTCPPIAGYKLAERPWKSAFSLTCFGPSDHSPPQLQFPATPVVYRETVFHSSPLQRCSPATVSREISSHVASWVVRSA